ncbi:MAG: M48 family metallopeptidase [Acidimicrobiaceae bacterium]|nr:M48 family metallopeptidase [Acidimicrobiaceae bacterium]
MRHHFAGRDFGKHLRSTKAANENSTAPFELWVKGIRVEVLRKDIKNLHLRVYPPDGRVRISAPDHFPIDSVLKVIEKRFEWIRSQQLRLGTGPVSLRYDDLETHWFLGNPCVLRVDETTSKPKVDFVDPGTIKLSTKGHSTIQQRQILLQQWYREQLRRQAAPLIQLWAGKLGVEVPELRIRKMSTRWGSCNVRARRVWLSLELAKKSKECLEYVVVHELAHLLEPSHGPGFRSQMNSALPNWRALKRELNVRL